MGATHYTSASAGPNPPTKSVKWSARMIPTMPGALKVGRAWVISVENYERWVTERQRPRKTTSPTVSSTIAEDVEAALREGGIRFTRKVG
ncbi:MAG: hypothetical protein U0169_02020 [Polyangiaceae bacterium]